MGDFYYLPMDSRSFKNRGFAFMNFISAEAAEEFYQAFHGKYFLIQTSKDKPLKVLPADHQGVEENYRKFVIEYTEPEKVRNAAKGQPVFFKNGGSTSAVQDKIKRKRKRNQTNSDGAGQPQTKRARGGGGVEYLSDREANELGL